MTAIEVAAGAAILSFVASIVGVFFTVRGNRSNVNLQYKHALRVAALDRRLAVHQEAYTLWWKLPTVAHDRNDARRTSYVRECENWWVKNWELYTLLTFVLDGLPSYPYSAFL